MGTWAVQLVTLLGVAVGATGSFVSTRLIDRSRWQREEALRWDSKRLEHYGDFASSLRQYVTVAQRICAGLNLPSTGYALHQEEGLPALAAAEGEASHKWEYVLMLGSPDVIAAGREWRHAGWRLEWFARGRLEGAEAYGKAMQDYQKARDQFYIAVRSDLSITSGDIPQGSWPPPWHQDTEQ